jgi:exopolysaccharide biosynthesis polyprenyl glycosylphosphotransferase
MFFWAVVFSPVWILVIKLHGLYDFDHRRIRHSTFDELPALVSACTLGTLVLVGLLSMTADGTPDPRTSILIGVIALAGCVYLRGLLRFSWHSLTGVASGVIVGSGSSSTAIARRIAVHPEARLKLVGYLAPESNSAGESPGSGSGHAELPLLGSVTAISAVASEFEIERVVVVEQAEMTEEEVEVLIAECKVAGLGLTIVPPHFRLLGPNIELNRVAELPVLDFGFSDPPRSTVMLKRAMDVAVSGTLLLALSPMFAIISLLILLDSGRPILFRQARAGQGGRPFTVLKFRTMVSDAEQRLGELVDLSSLAQPAFKIPADPRVTRIGRHLRRFSFDELPQLLNVLRGEMSLVGPRPEEEAVVALYDNRQRIRLAVRPGLTGPMQVYGRGDLDFEERLALERDYIDNISIRGDLAILVRTPRAILSGHGAY